ncbi:protein of unknown function (DUF1840) [Thioflavicoccus mobilis 8321]|uniref:DUF1840 domain-containing protein n=1 Tax=Thioflavicoccus mobilis 8321 TaxID=765912 RepID=L0GV55_9GAMM|nr:DUF1840 domain-containing protein [Thioflavicoccus mobilis]AGA89871.1 protein of unknown function (DUF1840) [Thioflavicoccus mobilis 8321]
MLVTFRTPAYADITMFGNVAETLLELMGHSGTIPGALLAEDIPEALGRLKAAVGEHPDRPLDPETSGEREEEQVHVSLAHRALPLIELLAAAAAAKENVIWDKA